MKPGIIAILVEQITLKQFKKCLNRDEVLTEQLEAAVSYENAEESERIWGLMRLNWKRYNNDYS